VNRFCASGLQSIATAAERIAAGAADLIVAGGVESMSLVPMGGNKYSANPSLVSSWPEAYAGMGITAELVAKKYGVSRADQDAFAAESHRRAARAQAEGWFAGELVPVDVETTAVIAGKLSRATERLEADEGVRGDTTAEGLSKLKPAFQVDGTVTAGNASQMTDGAAAVVVVSERYLKESGARPLARFVSYGVRGVAPELMGIGPIEAIPLALSRAGLKQDDLAALELNEAFAAQSLACIDELGLDPAKVNIDGGAIALGHPLGATGARITGKAAALLVREGKRYALATQCIGGGQGIATILERI
jgi:acetyl-CoA acyltransferase